MTASQTIEGSLGTDCVGRVEFFPWKDRIAHRVEIRRGGASQMWESVEGDQQQNWPPSPPFQDISIERIHESNVALLVGMAGKSHWSLSVDIDAERGSIRFDVACRIADVAEQLRSSYRGPTAAAMDTPVVAGLGSTLRQLDDTWCIEPEAIDNPNATVRWMYEFCSGPSVNEFAASET
jgi:hypothetical protein